MRLASCCALRLNGEALSIAREIGVPALVAAGLVMRGRLLASNGKHDEARDCLEEAQRVAREVGVPDSIALAACHLALLPGGDAARARATVDELGERMDHLFLTEAQFLLWRATADRAHLAEAKRLVEEALVNAPEEHRDAMLENVPLHRDIWKATQEAGL